MTTHSPKLDALRTRLSSVEVAHEDHRTRFRPPTVNEHARTIHWLRQHEVINAWFDAGSPGLRPDIDGDAMLPHGMEFDSTGDIVVGLDDQDRTKWVHCKQCVDLGAEAIRNLFASRAPQATDQQLAAFADAVGFDIKKLIGA